jgi:hypothetical protein
MRGWLPASEVEMLYGAIAQFRGYDTLIDNTAMGVEALSEMLLTIMEETARA